MQKMFIFKKAEKGKKTLRDNDIMRTVINFQLKEFENIRKYGNFVGSKKKILALCEIKIVKS